MTKAEKLFDMQLEGVSGLLLTVYYNPSIVEGAPDTAEMSDSYRLDSSMEFLYQVWTDGVENRLVGGFKREPLTHFEEGFSEQNLLGYRWRLLTRYNPEKKLWIMVGERTDLRFILAENVVVQSILPILIGLPVAAVFIWWLIGSGLSILNRLAQDLTSKQVDDLSAIYYENTPTELSTVVDSINRLFNRLDQSFQRERNFASDAAHELRTPISALKVHIYNLKHQCHKNPEIVDAIESDLLRLEHLVEQILLLYRTTPENYNSKKAMIDLKELLIESVAQMYPDFERKHQAFELQADKSLFVQGDSNFINILLSNLLSNANKYTPQSGRVIVTLSEESQWIWLVVKNSGPGIPEADYNRVFDRFYRMGGDRHASNEPGCGLGLSIVKHIAELHKAKTVLSKTEDDFFSVAIGFPKMNDLKEAENKRLDECQ